MNVGEQLNVLDEATVRNGNDDRDALWYKVSPPAGEFRWIEQSAVSTTAPEIITQVAEEKPSPQRQSKAPVQTASFTQEPNAEVSRPQQSSSGAIHAPRTKTGQKHQDSYTARETVQTEQRRPQRAGSAKSKSEGSEWDGWYAFEMSDQGVRTPFLTSQRTRSRNKSTHQVQGSTA